MKKVFIIAEAGVNHNGSLERAMHMIDVAYEAGADAVKFQSFTADKIVTHQAKQAEYQQNNTQIKQSQYELLKKLELSQNDFLILRNYANKKNIVFLSTPFDSSYLHYLVDELAMPIVKIPSGEVTNGPFLLEIASKNKSVVMSTGMCNLEEVEIALGCLAFGFLGKTNPSISEFLETLKSEEGQAVLKEKVTLLHCTTDYPTPYEDANLNVLKTFQQKFPNVPYGYSDHTLDIFIPMAAVSLGASLIEKHFTLDKTLEGPDHKASINPDELAYMVRGIRAIEQGLGSYEKKPTESEIKNRVVARRSLVAKTSIKQGDLITASLVDIKRPGTGLNPMNYWKVIGMLSQHPYQKDELLREETI